MVLSGLELVAWMTTLYFQWLLFPLMLFLLMLNLLFGSFEMIVWNDHL